MTLHQCDIRTILGSIAATDSELQSLHILEEIGRIILCLEPPDLALYARFSNPLKSRY